MIVDEQSRQATPSAFSAPNPFLRDTLYSHGGSRHAQYNTLTGELLLVGEEAHGMDWFSGGGGFWWCSFGGAHSSPLLSFLLREATVEHHATPGHYPPGLAAPYTDDGAYSVVRLEPLAAQSAYVNLQSGQTAYPADYRELVDPAGTLEFFLYQDVDETINIAVMGAGVAGLASPGEALGDGTSNRDNGVRMHIAFRTTITLPPDKLEWTGRLDQQSAAYRTEHPTGC
ncbi:MAG: hypothetical protein GY711_07190 [bacterium]|nr:hypothetical protein [bacterium]